MTKKKLLGAALAALFAMNVAAVAVHADMSTAEGKAKCKTMSKHHCKGMKAKCKGMKAKCKGMKAKCKGMKKSHKVN